MVTTPLSVEDAEYVAQMTAEQMSHYEPLPPFETRFPGKLEACLMAPFQTFDGKPLYTRLTRKAAVLFYGVIKNHPFANGNKRMAVTLTLVFLFINGKWINTKPLMLYDIARAVAKSDPKNREKVIDILVHDFNSKLIDVSKEQRS